MLGKRSAIARAPSVMTAPATEGCAMRYGLPVTSQCALAGDGRRRQATGPVAIPGLNVTAPGRGDALSAALRGPVGSTAPSGPAA
jgi:hypothetical protein